ncbi:MAG: DUF5317 domain-containing protein [Clostridiales bacterium]|nr:DUF5317 domain-containing protein [Clostridiales bacterium]
MILFLFVVIGIIAGFVKNRVQGLHFSFSEISNLRGLWLPIAGVLLDGSFSFAPRFALRYAAIITCTEYLCIFAFLYLNRRYRLSCALMAAGSLSNFLVIAANGFRMPVSAAALAMFPGMTAQAVYARRANYFIVQGRANLYFLADIIPVPVRGFGAFISVGDLVLGVGIMLLLIAVISPKPEPAGTPARQQ